MLALGPASREPTVTEVLVRRVGGDVCARWQAAWREMGKDWGRLHGTVNSRGKEENET